MDSLALVIFGITGNLAQIKLIPALYDMAEKNLLPDNVSIIGIARKDLSREEFCAYLDEVVHRENLHHNHEIKQEVVDKLFSRFHYLNGELDDPVFYNKLKDYLESLDKNGRDNRIYYLATYPDLYSSIFENLQALGLNKQDDGYVRLMIEKPIGNDLKSAQDLNLLLQKYFDENQIYRLDHYLGKETLQNILIFRFGNEVFEPLMNKDYIDHIQITAGEDFGIGARGGYYDTVGALKDVGQNHQLQMLAFATMDAPSEFTNQAVTAERIKILESIVPNPEKIVFGQYQGYLGEPNIKEGSKTDTFYALKTEINNERFKGVPVYIRAGKKLKQTVTEISVVFKVPSNRLFQDKQESMSPNILVYRIQPNEGIVLKIFSKKPGHTVDVSEEYMQFCYKTTGNDLPDPYEHLISDTILGDQTFFNDAKEVEAQWAFTDPLSAVNKDPYIYNVGSWGPKEADELIEEDGRHWLEPSMEFCRI